MAVDSCTLIIKCQTFKSDAELLKMLKLYEKPSHKIGSENLKYNDAISNNSQSIFITSNESLIIILGMPLVYDFVYTNPYNAIFPDCEFFFMFNESVSMLNGFVYGKGSNIIRRKYVQNGKYYKAYDIEPDIGIPLIEEKEFYDFNSHNELEKMQMEEYLFGVYDYDVSLKFIDRNFVRNPIGFLEGLTFNRNINKDLDNYIQDSNNKVNAKDINYQFYEEIKKLAKELKFKKINFEGKDGKINNKGYFIQLNNCKIIIEPQKLLSISPFEYIVSIEQDDSPEWIKANIHKSNYGITFFSFKPTVYIKLNPNGNDYIYTRKDLDLAFMDFTKELNAFKELICFFESTSVEKLFSNNKFYDYVFDKIAKNINTLDVFSYRDEINFCILHYFYTKDNIKSMELIKLLDHNLNDKTKNQIHQVYPRIAIENL